MGIRLVFKIISIIIAVGLICCALVLGGIMYFNAPPDKVVTTNENDEFILEVRSGETAYSVGRRLEDAGVIRSRYFWNLLFRIDKDYIKTGTYRIEIPASQIKIRSILVSGEQILIKVTIPEGVTLKKASRILEEGGICGADEFLAAASSGEILDKYKVPGTDMEGYLYPDTYLFPLAYPAKQVVSAMADNFFKRMENIAPEFFTPWGVQGLGADELNNRVIIASIVEREYRIAEEAAVMAGVFYNRMKRGMALQSCATVEYVITEIQGRPHPEVLFNRDLEINDPYNTYIRSGLPPGPISAPGETALRAAFYPVTSDYLYFRLTEPSIGRHYFSNTLDDHIRAGALYTKGS